MKNQIGVFYKKEAYIGIFKRILIDLIDLFVLIIVYILFANVWPTFSFLLWFLWAFLYMAIFKTVGMPTLGYLIFKVKIVDIYGNRPSIFRTSFRFLFLCIGPFNWLIDLLCSIGDSHKQALRDKLCETYMIKKDAEIIGNGIIVYKILWLLGVSLGFRDVARDNETDQSFTSTTTDALTRRSSTTTVAR